MLILKSPQQYALQLKNGGGYGLSRCACVSKFDAPASTRGLAKLYTLSFDAKLLYVGIAQQPMASRLNYGLKAMGKGGYHGYKWKHLRHPMKLNIWTATMLNENASFRELETVKAEVAYLCRHLSGQWPEFQHEIHFYPSQQHHRDAAQRVFELAVAA